MGPPSISAALQRTIDEVGSPARAWIAQVPGQLDRTRRSWDLRIERQRRHDGVASLLYEVTTAEGTPAVLKLAVPHPESRREAAALERWRGVGAVRLLRSSADGFTLLLERCDPGHDLWTVDLDVQMEVVADLLPQLWIGPGTTPFPSLAVTARRWADQLTASRPTPLLPSERVHQVVGWIDGLLADLPRQLLHGDLHPGNVLAGRRSPWLAIDPKPWVGDPAFDLAQPLVNWLPDDHDDAVATARTLARRLARRLDLDEQRVLRWAAIKALGWGAGQDRTRALVAAAAPSARGR